MRCLILQDLPFAHCNLQNVLGNAGLGRHAVPPPPLLTLHTARTNALLVGFPTLSPLAPSYVRVQIKRIGGGGPPLEERDTRVLTNSVNPMWEEW